jgi:hypothetical protein
LRHGPYTFSVFTVVPVLSSLGSSIFLPWDLGKTDLCRGFESIGFFPSRLVQLAVEVITPTIWLLAYFQQGRNLPGALSSVHSEEPEAAVEEGRAN